MNFEIINWNPVIIGNETFPYPMAYLIPNEELKKEIEYNPNVNISIRGTYIYDNFKTNLYGLLLPSSYFPNYRPNFYNDKHYYCLVIFTNWEGYPKNNGKVIFNPRDYNIKSSEVVQPLYSAW